MKKFTTLALCLLFLPIHVHASEIIQSRQIQLSGYGVSVEEGPSFLRIQVRSSSPYGVFLQYSKNRHAYQNGKNIKYLTAVFDSAASINLQDGVKASDTYSIRVDKGNLDQVFLTVKTGNFINTDEQLIWEKPIPVE